jgi:siroheme synthase-like protein
MSSSSTNNLFPIFLKLEELNLLIVGGGLIGLEKLNAILDNSPKTKIKLVAKEINDDIKKLATEYSNLQLIEKGYEKTDLKGIDIAIAAVSDIQLSQIVKTDAKEAGILLNAADKPSICDFYLGSIVQKGDLKIAISTNGKSPTMAKRVKETLNEVFPNETQEVLENLYKIRESLKGNFEYKVKTLNNLTKNYELPSVAKNETNKIVKTALYSVAIIFLRYW